MTPRINGSEACIVCARRASAFAIGHPKRLGWYCAQCGPIVASYAYRMTSKDFDLTEKGACRLVADMLADAGDPDAPVVIPRHELAEFIAWTVEQFAKSMREYMNSGEVPF